MSNAVARIDDFADLGAVWLRNQTARLQQKQLLFGRHFRVDVEGILARAARTARVARLLDAATPRGLRRTTPFDGPRAKLSCNTLAPKIRPSARSPSENDMQSPRVPMRRRAAGPAGFGGFALLDLGPYPRVEWMTILSDLTEVVVADVNGAPSSLGVEKAASIVQSRSYLEGRARQLLVPFTKDQGDWRLVTIDFGVEARRHECEFLMCFVLHAAGSELCTSSPYIEVGFALPSQAGEDRVFVLTVKTASGLIA